MNKRRVIWSHQAKLSLKAHYEYIKQDSVSAARRVKAEIINASKELASYSEKYQLDEFYPNNPGNIRRFFRWSYRIIYQVNEREIAILNVVHSSQEPAKA